MDIAVIGTGYVGLVTGTCFADSGNSVTCVDVDKEKLRRLKSGDPVIYEQGLEFILHRNIKENRIHFTDDIEGAVTNSLIIFLAVGTPSSEDGSADLRYIREAAASVGRHINGYKIIVNKSTVPVGTAGIVDGIIREELKKRKMDHLDFDVVSNPEFLKEGTAVADFQKPDRIVIGTNSKKAADIMKELYEPFCRSGERFHIMDPKSAEITKYASNCFLATKISFINQIAALCSAVGADINDVRAAMGADPRIGNKFLFPGTGYGGSCFPKDVRALIKTGGDHQTPMSILEQVDEVNEYQKGFLFRCAADYYGGSSGLKDRTFAVWGLSFKPGTDDIREAPSLVTIKNLLEAGAKIRAFDPIAAENMKKKFGGIEYVLDQYDVLKGADALIIQTEWNEFRTPDFAKIRNNLAQPVVFDGRNLYSRKKMTGNGFVYFCVGRPPVHGEGNG